MDVPFFYHKGERLLFMDIELVFIREDYFREHIHFEKILDTNNPIKGSRRHYLFVKVGFNGNQIFVPLKSNLGDPNRYGKIGYSVPSTKRPNAGLDYRCILIINEEKYLERPEYIKLNKDQLKLIQSNYNIIEKEVVGYIKGYIKSVTKKRSHIDKKFKESSLRNFHVELGIEEKKESEQEKGVA